ncbi:MAG: hypothetical protein JO146_07805 [Candidatus Eremiobacteraeota bacterium]|nr:hypothetical protein [Candidatus Eremiobacteraeota bacterium]
MNDRAFRLDFFIAIGALLVSALTAGTLIYQTRVIGDQFSATIWPYLTLSTTYELRGVTISVDNDGVGPALVHAARLTLDGKFEPSWNAYLVALLHKSGLHLRPRSGVQIMMSSIGPSSTLRAGESRMLLKFTLPQGVQIARLVEHTTTVDVCYCSLNGTCWMLHDVSGQIGHTPQPVSRCADDTAIQSNPFFARPGAAPAR